jgi:uncharacterized protein
MPNEFINRKIELGMLRGKYAQLAKGSIITLYGRRRVGKTELIREFLKSIPSEKKLYVYIDLAQKQETLLELGRAVSSQLGDQQRFDSFRDFLDYIAKKATEGKFVLVIDEFQRFLDIAPEYITQLQDLWDSSLRNLPLLILLVGSSIGMMQRITEGKTGALYGRAAHVKISPFRYVDFRMMFPDRSEEEKIEHYAVFGGTPYYLEKTLAYKSTADAIDGLVLQKGGELFDEPKTLLEYENVRIHARYNSILTALATGKEILKEIEDVTGIPSTTLPAYLQRLDSLLDLVERRDPMLGKERLGRYILRDCFFRFWYRFIFPNQTALNLGNTQLVSGLIRENLNGYVGVIFEEVVKELFRIHLNKKIKNIEINFENIGRWWNKKGEEIDVVAFNSHTRWILVGEVKWSNQLVDKDILEDLQRKAKLIPFNGTYQYLLVSKSGFTENCKKEIQRLNVLSLDLGEVSDLFDKVS